MNSKTNTIIVAGIATLLAAGGIFLVRNLTSEGPKENEESKEKTVMTEKPEMTDEEGAAVLSEPVVTIVYTEDGFSPNVVTVKKGDKVRWVNESSAMMWVASAVHPTHQLYPEFDQRETVDRGGVYEFAFDKIGDWKYHSHTNPSITAAVIVEEAVTDVSTESSQ
ncbi:cupredoxin domain-containing protein [candidate division WWE3 bacterium]|nr:cupredoxin domain-containing protein [candidate division WWE3 bacterium]